jgi:uridine kinase
MSDRSAALETAAWKVLEQSAKPFGFVATAQDKDNYARLWSRDSAIASLAVLAQEKKSLYPAVQASIENLLDAVGVHGVFPSNVGFSDGSTFSDISYGGPVGRTDSPFWWAIAALSYIETVPNESLKQRIQDHLEVIEYRAHAWEFNNKHLMYAPASSNWADEYPVEGYILLNNVLRYWMLQKAGRVFNHNGYRKKAVAVLLSIKSHFFGEPAEAMTLFTSAQRAELENLNEGDRLLMNFTPGSLNNHIDALGWSISFLTGAASKITMNKAFDRWAKGPLAAGKIPAHWPIITEQDPQWTDLKSNFAYAFKNHPGHFHNGGVWGLTQGFAAAMMQELGRDEFGVLEAYEKMLTSSQEQHPFAEYYSFEGLEPGGVQNLCFSAASYLLACAARDKKAAFKRVFERPQQPEREMVVRIARNIATEILQVAPSKIYKISGESGCGKTTLARAIVQLLEEQGKRVLLISQDDFFKLPPRQNHNKRVEDFSWIGPQEVNFELLNACIREALEVKGHTMKIPVMNWERDKQDWVEVSTEKLDAIIIEGTYVLHEKAADEVGIFFTHTYEDTKEARIARNREVVDDFIQRVLAREHELIAPLRANADFSISKDYRII